VITWTFLPAPSRDDRRVSVTHPGGVTVLLVENCSIGVKLHRENGPELDADDADELRWDIERHDNAPYVKARYMRAA
jgi:hypothetical protein